MTNTIEPHIFACQHIAAPLAAAVTITPVILAGGMGARLWPLSRRGCPKQFIALFSRRTLFQQTVARLKYFSFASAPLIICNQQHRKLVARQLKAVSSTAALIIEEPLRKNTAPAIAIAALQLQRNDPNAIMLVLPSDHAIDGADSLSQVFAQAIPYAAKQRLVCFGVRPRQPKTGFGYIEFGETINENTEENSVFPVCRVARFVEKPSFAKAQEYVASGKYYWNSGMFMFRASTYLDALQKHAPDVFTACKKVMTQSVYHDNTLHLSAEVFAQVRAISIDYAVMEQAIHQTLVLPLNLNWSDVGSWQAVWEYGKQLLQHSGKIRE